MGFAVGMGRHRRDEGLNMDGFFSSIWWCIIGGSYCMGVCYFTVDIMFEDGHSWWLPLLLPVAVPLMWLYENRNGIAALLTILMLLIGVSTLYVKVSL